MFLNHDNCPATVGQALLVGLPHIDPASWAARDEWGGIFLNGAPSRIAIELKPPCKIEYYEPKFEFSEASKLFPPFKEDYIVHREDGLAFVFKPAKLPALGSKEQRKFSLQSYLEGFFGSAIHLPSRLDMSASGLTLISYDLNSHEIAQKLFEKRMIEKLYLVGCTGTPAWSETILNRPIGYDPFHTVLRKISLDGSKSLTRFAIRAERTFTDQHGERYPGVLIDASPHTGRTHQIRVHIASLGLPIVGDNFYDGIEHPNLHLICYRLRFTHPITKKLFDVRVPERLLPEWLRGVDLAYSPLLP